MPVSGAAIFRAIVLLLMIAHAFYMYCLARGISGSVGLGVLAVGGAALFALVMMIPLAGAVGLADLPEVARWLRRQRRWRGGRCAVCGYAVGFGESDSCPECSEPVREPEVYRLSADALRRFGAMALLAWVLGTTAGAIWIDHDERAFEREASRHAATGGRELYARSRIWPLGGYQLMYRPGEGVRAE